MIKILLLEDEQEKIQAITEVLLSVEGITSNNIDHYVAAVDAKRQLKERRYNLLVLDLNVPPRLNLPVRVGAGLEVLRAVRERLPGVQAPEYVIGLTAYDDAQAKAADDFDNPLWKLIRFDYSSPAWRRQLQSAAEYIVGKSKPPFLADGTTYHTTLGIVVGLEDVELQAILALETNFEQIHIEHDPIRYFRGTFSGNGRHVDVVVAAAPRMGMPIAAVVATKLVEAFRPRYLAMTGICAGVRGKTKLGDILVADPCWDWGSGKISSASRGQAEHLPAPYQWRLNADVRTWLKDMGDDDALLEGIHSAWPGRKPKSRPKVLIDALATGGSVIGRKAAMDAIRKQHKNLIGVEMEIFAVLTAGEIASSPRPIGFGVKSVCDFGDERKSDYAHRYAAYASARFVRELALRHM